MPPRKPVLGHGVAASKQPDAGAIPRPKHIVFSFKYFREFEYFGLGSQDRGWFIALLEKFSELSKETIGALNTDPGKRRAWRFHPINWNQPNIPVRRSDLIWVNQEILNNEAEFPFYQFQITTALGRVVGFFDDENVFNVVLFDPLHNIQPSKRFDYRVRETIISESAAADLIRFVEIRLAACPAAECVCRVEYAEFQRQAIGDRDGHSIIVGLDADRYTRVVRLINCGLAHSVSDLIDIALGELAEFTT